MKKYLALLTSCFLVSAMVIAPPSASAAGLSISAPSALLLDQQTNRVIYSKTPHTKRAPASTTKLLTSMVAMDLLSLKAVVTVPKFAEGIEPTKIHLRAGERYYMKDLLKATLIKSANDAAEVLAHAAGGSRSRFAEKMNAKARSLGCKGARFVRASGLPARGQVSSAYCMALIMKEISKYPYIVKTLKIRNTSIRSLAGRKIYIKSHNKLLMRGGRDVIGKTGWTRKARYCFVGQITRGGRKIVVAMLGSHSLWRDLTRLVNYQFSRTLTRVKTNTRLWGRKETRSIQTALKRAGYNPGKVDGMFGSKTVLAVEKFQRAHGLRDDGIVGPVTMTRLQSYLLYSQGDMKKIQSALKHAGYSPGPVDGILGPRSQSALKSFQRSAGLTADGIVGSQTWKKLQAYL